MQWGKLTLVDKEHTYTIREKLFSTIKENEKNDYQQNEIET